jgi:hypothetical protein
MKQKIGRLITIMFVVLFLQGLPQSIAWKNGSYANTAIEYDTATDYGTHDWVADAALQGLRTTNASKWQWLQDRLSIYLLGTEAPDNPGINTNFDGTPVTGFGDTNHHHVYHNIDGSIYYNEDDSAVRAKWCGDQADVALSEQKYDLAAYYLGAMTHYIADMGVYAHVSPNNVPPYNVDFDTYHATYEDRVYTRSNNYNNKEEFFRIHSFTPGSAAPFNVTIQLAWDTFADPNPTESVVRNVKWMHDHFFSTWASDLADRATESANNQLYYDRVEQSLNNAIQAVAAALNFVTSGSNTPSITTSDPTEEEDLSLPGYPLMLCIVISLFAITNRLLRIKRD